VGAFFWFAIIGRAGDLLVRTGEQAQRRHECRRQCRRCLLRWTLLAAIVILARKSTGAVFASNTLLFVFFGIADLIELVRLSGERQAMR
jgi:hypothetical protein